jgi:hypothetical protein
LLALQRCALCQIAAYCGRDCQKAAWKRHKPDCALLTALASLRTRDGVRLCGQRLAQLYLHVLDTHPACRHSFDRAAGQQVFDSLATTA